MNYAKYKGTIFLTVSQVEFQNFKKKFDMEKPWRLDLTGTAHLYRLSPVLGMSDGPGWDMPNNHNIYRLRFQTSGLPQVIADYPLAKAHPVEYEVTDEGIMFLLDPTVFRPPTVIHDRQQLPKKAVTDEMEQFKQAVGTVNRLRRAVSAELSVHNGALFADISITKKVRIS